MHGGLQEVAVARRALRIELEVFYAPVLQDDQLDVLPAHVADHVGMGIKVQRRLGVRHRFYDGRIGVEHVSAECPWRSRWCPCPESSASRLVLRPARAGCANMSMRVFDGVALGKLVALHQDVLVFIEQHGLGRSRAAVDAHEAFHHLARAGTSRARISSACSAP